MPELLQHQNAYISLEKVLIFQDSQKFNCSDLRMAPNENLARFVSEFDEGPKQVRVFFVVEGNSSSEI